MASVTDDSLAEVAEFYTRAMENLGLEVQSTSTSGPDGNSQILAGSLDEQTLNVVAVEDGDQVRININFSGPA